MLRLLIIIAAIYLIARSQIQKFISKNRLELLKNRNNLIKYAASNIILGSVISLLPSILINQYMRENGFFAYEVFQENQASFRILILNTWAYILLLSAYFFGFLPALALKADRKSIITIFAINIVTIIVALYGAQKNGTWFTLMVFLTPSLAISLYTTFLIKTGVTEKAKIWFLPLFIALVLLATPFLYSDISAKFTEKFLEYLNIGGYPVTIQNTILKHENVKYPQKEYWLLLRTNDKIYIKENKESSLSIVLPLQEYAVIRKQ